jgi:hypothetical protein
MQMLTLSLSALALLAECWQREMTQTVTVTQQRIHRLAWLGGAGQ